MPAASIQPLCFGPPARRLFGILHPAAPQETGRAGVVLCNPFGQEAVRAQRAFRVLAERLSRAGHAVLRFDYYGSGDSMGDDLDADLDGWAADLRAADKELRTRDGAGQTIWLGMRLGGAVALRGAEQGSPANLMRLILWDPVIDGGRYLDHLRERHVSSLAQAFSVPQVPPPEQVARDPVRFRDEAIGFALSPLLREQIAQLRPTHMRWPARPSSIVILTNPDDLAGGEVGTVCEREPGRVRLLEVRHGADWTSDTAEDDVLVPMPALVQLVRQAALPL